MTPPNDRYLTPERLRLLIDEGDDRHGRDGVHRHAGTAAGQAPARAVLPRRRARARHRGLQLPARGRHRHEHRRRLRDLVVGARLRRHGVRARLVDTLRLLPHLPATAMVQCDLVWLDHAPVLQSPRTILRHQLDKVAERGHGGARGHRAGVHRLRHVLRGRPPPRLARPDAGQPVQRRLLDPRHQPGGAAAPRHPQPHVRRRARRRGREGRVQLRPARDRLPVRRRDDDRRQPQRLQDRGQGDRGPARPGDHVHGQVQRARGQLLPHPPVAARRTTATSSSGTATSARRSTTSSSPACSRRCASSPCSTRRTSTPTSGSRPGRSRRRPSPGAWTTAPARSAWSGTAPARGWRTACPAATSTRTSPSPAMLAGGLHGIENELDARGRARRQRLRLRQAARARTRCATPATLFAGSDIARAAFGDEVVDHYINMADVELAAFDAHVTDWELARSFERM